LSTETERLHQRLAGVRAGVDRHEGA